MTTKPEASTGGGDFNDIEAPFAVEDNEAESSEAIRDELSTDTTMPEAKESEDMREVHHICFDRACQNFDRPSTSHSDFNSPLSFELHDNTDITDCAEQCETMSSRNNIHDPIPRPSYQSERGTMISNKIELPTTRRFSFQFWKSWSLDRKRYTVFGCISSCIVLAIRLVLDAQPLAYLIHSIIVFLDMVLIHLFTHSPWLSIAGELTTVVFFLAFHFSKQTVYELLETTIIAIWCSIHLIASRNKHKERQQELTVGVEHLRRQTMILLHAEEEMGSQVSLQEIHHQTSTMLRDIQGLEHTQVSEHESTEIQSNWKDSIRSEYDGRNSIRDDLKFHHWLIPHRAHLCGANFYEFFLDGSAGVMYTSFLGLILSEIITTMQGNDGKGCK